MASERRSLSIIEPCLAEFERTAALVDIASYVSIACSTGAELCEASPLPPLVTGTLGDYPGARQVLGARPRAAG